MNGKDNRKHNIMKSKLTVEQSFTVKSTLLVVFALLFIGFFIAGVNGSIEFAFLKNIGWVSDIYEWVIGMRYLPLVLVFLPILGVIIFMWRGRNSCYNRDMVVILMTLLTLLVTLFSYPSAQEGGMLLEIPGVFNLGLSFNIDMFSFTMLLLTSVVWFLVMVYAHEYMRRELHCNRFFFFMGITYSAVLGALVSADLFTLFLFFEIMTFASYMLVIHGQKEDSYSAGYNYIFMGIIGGFAILVALLLLYFHVGDVSFASAIHLLNDAGSIKYWIIGLLIFGFGIKAGMAPVHVWLPRAHPVAPTPASALLSGIMIKLGAYGILRVAVSYYFPTTYISGSDPIWFTAESIGAVVIWLGIITMGLGVFFALQQANIKRMLAYSSISQMGYILMGIGVALYLGSYGAMGFAGALYHIINHALFKSLLFMVAGVVYYHTGEYNMYKLGGLYRKLPLTGTVALIASLGIAGIPLFNGFISKSILHHGIVEAYTYGSSMFRYAEIIFIIISAGTFATLFKFMYYVFFRKRPKSLTKEIKPEYNNLDTAMAVVGIIIVFIGLNPRFILDTFIIPILNVLPYSPDFVSTYIVDLAFFTRYDLISMGYVVVGGLALFFVGTKLHLFNLKLPYWMSVEFLVFYPLNILIRKSCRAMYGEACKYNEDTLKLLALKNNKEVGFLDRLVLMANVFNSRYESKMIRSDAFIYTLFITGVLLFMLVMQLI